MPLYEYKCDACGATFELIQKFSDPPADTCQKCGKGPVQKLVSSPAFQFKGSGWYITDYAQKGKSSGDSAGKDSGGDKAAAASSDSGGGDSAKKSEAPAAAPAASTKD